MQTDDMNNHVYTILSSICIQVVILLKHVIMRIHSQYITCTNQSLLYSGPLYTSDVTQDITTNVSCNMFWQFFVGSVVFLSKYLRHLSEW